jgi:hypothetical protein
VPQKDLKNKRRQLYPANFAKPIKTTTGSFKNKPLYLCIFTYIPKIRGGQESMRRCIVCTCVIIQNRTNRVGGVVIISVFLPIVVGRGLSTVRPNND